MPFIYGGGIKRTASSATNNTTAARPVPAADLDDPLDRDLRKVGRPVSQPLGGSDEYAIPRARVSTKRGDQPGGAGASAAGADAAGKRAAAIRTRDGRSVKASDYLKDHRIDKDMYNMDERNNGKRGVGVRGI